MAIYVAFRRQAARTVRDPLSNRAPGNYEQASNHNYRNYRVIITAYPRIACHPFVRQEKPKLATLNNRIKV